MCSRRKLKTDTKSLDFNSNPATQYQFANQATPYFDVIDSPKFVGSAGYYSNVSDNAREQKLGINYAGHVYQRTRLAGYREERYQLVENMLMGQTIVMQPLTGLALPWPNASF